MAFVVETTDHRLPQEAMRSIVEAVDTWRGQEEAFVVFKNKAPYEIISVQGSKADAEAAVQQVQGSNYFGPVAPRSKPTSFVTVLKPQGCNLLALKEAVSSVVLRKGNQTVKTLTVNVDGRPPETDDIEAIFLTPAGIDKFMIPYLTRVFGAEYAAAKRREWIKE